MTNDAILTDNLAAAGLEWICDSTGKFTARVQIGGRTGGPFANSIPRSITMALAIAIGLKVAP
ncbi:MAG TPA: hypothetical protein VIY49_31795 [Bryobacteraceae bacterium]